MALRQQIGQVFTFVLDRGTPIKLFSRFVIYFNCRSIYELLLSSLQLGPFCGMPACQTLKFSKGVCGAAADQKRTLLVENVHDFPGHVACDAASNSELVVPIFHQVKSQRV